MFGLSWFIIVITIICIAAASKSDKNKKRKISSNTNQSHRQPMYKNANQGPDILARAKANNQRFNDDRTITEIEKMHGHSESNTPISDIFEHSRVCDNNKNNVAINNKTNKKATKVANGINKSTDNNNSNAIIENIRRKNAEVNASAVNDITKAQELESSLGTIEDLMTKGYDGNMTFDRDFISEAMDMLNSISNI